MRKSKLTAVTSAIVLVNAIASTSAAANAQEASSSDETTADTSNGDEIIVSARRKEERLQDVPLSVSAVGEETLKRQNIVNVQEIGRVSPSVTAQSGNSGGRALPTFAIRGQAQNELTALADPSVSIYSGDILVARPQGVNSLLLDIGTVEVLRGPQGTLFGRNTTGGAIILRPNRPAEDFGGSASLTYGRFNMVNTELVLNVPLSEDVSIRAAFGSANDDGYIYDEILGRNINRTSQRAARVSLLLTPGNIESLTVANYFHENDGGVGNSIVAFNANANGGAGPTFNGAAFRAGRNYADFSTLFAQQQARGLYRIANGTPEYTKVETFDVANTTTVALSDAISIRNIIGYREVEGSSLSDADGTSNSAFMIERFEDGHQFSNELHLLGDMGGLDWIAGLFYFKETASNQGQSAVGTVDPGLFEPQHVALYTSAYTNTWVKANNKSYAAFAQGTAMLTDGLSLTLGARYTRDKRGATIFNRTATACRYSRDLDGNPSTPETPAASVGLANCNLSLGESFSAVTWNASLDYKLAPGKLIYLAHRKGYRSGGFGARAGTEAGLRRTFRPETLYDVEAGFKGDWNLGESFLRTNISAYYGWYKDLQRLLNDPTTTPITTVTTNAGKARIYGVEAELLFRPIPQIELTANFAHTNAKFIEFLGVDGVDRSNFPLARAPKNVYTLGARFYPETSSSLGDVSLGASIYHTDRFSTGDEVFGASTFNGGYEIVNADLSIGNFMESEVDIRLFATNLLNKTYVSNYGENFTSGINAAGGLNNVTFGFTSAYPNRPRTFGVTAKISFGGE